MIDVYVCIVSFLFFKQKTAYEMRISDWSSDVCSSDLDACMGECIIVKCSHRRQMEILNYGNADSAQPARRGTPRPSRAGRRTWPQHRGRSARQDRKSVV